MNTEGAASGPMAADDAARPAAARHRILVVDDESDVLVFLTDLLQMEGFVVDTARDGADALNRIAQTTYDALLVDLRMPLVTGVELLDQVERRHPALSHRTIFMTGDLYYAERLALVTRAGVPLVTKPFRAEELVQALRLVLDR